MKQPGKYSRLGEKELGTHLLVKVIDFKNGTRQHYCMLFSSHFQLYRWRQRIGYKEDGCFAKQIVMEGRAAGDLGMSVRE